MPNKHHKITAIIKESKNCDRLVLLEKTFYNHRKKNWRGNQNNVSSPNIHIGDRKETNIPYELPKAWKER